jgi:hypothetical protein
LSTNQSAGVGLRFLASASESAAMTGLGAL